LCLLVKLETILGLFFRHSCRICSSNRTCEQFGSHYSCVSIESSLLFIILLRILWCFRSSQITLAATSKASLVPIYHEIQSGSYDFLYVILFILMHFNNKCNIQFMPILGHADEAILCKRRQLRYGQYDCVFFISLP